jgi:signal transduction histidine kinase
MGGSNFVGLEDALRLLLGPRLETETRAPDYCHRSSWMHPLGRCRSGMPGLLFMAMDTRTGRLLDAALALAGAVALILDGVLSSDGVLPAAAYPLAVLAAAPLAFRRRAPLAALFGVEAGAIACVAVFGPKWAAIAIVMVALFTAALLGDRKRSLIAGAVTGVALVGATLILDSSIELTSAALRLLLLLAALALGDTVRSRRALRAAALEKARRDEREREERSRRRVANERMRIARELHDTLAHSLAAINVRAGVAAHLGNLQDPSEALLEIKQLSADALRDLRVTLGLLREQDEKAPVLPVLDLADLPGLADRARAAGIDAEVDIELNGQAVPSPVGQAAFRIVQEALTNVIRHAHASSAHVHVGKTDDALLVEITDDGRGGIGGVEGHGLRGMGERAAALGGRVAAGPRAEGGWQIRALLPLSRIDDA